MLIPFHLSPAMTAKLISEKDSTITRTTQVFNAIDAAHVFFRLHRLLLPEKGESVFCHLFNIAIF